MPCCNPVRPVCRSMKSVICDGIMLVALIAIVGHLGVNFWERYIIQSELLQMKQSLQYLKTAINNIGNAYDKLHMQIKGLTDGTFKKNSLQYKMINDRPPDDDTYDNNYAMSSKPQHKAKGNTMYDKNNEVISGAITVSNNENFFIKNDNSDGFLSTSYGDDKSGKNGKQFSNRGGANSEAKLNTQKGKQYVSRDTNADNASNYLESFAYSEDKQLQQNENTGNKSNRSLKETASKNNTDQRHLRKAFTKDADSQFSSKTMSISGGKYLPKSPADNYLPGNNNAENVANQLSPKSVTRDESSKYPPKAISKNAAKYLTPKRYVENEQNNLPINIANQNSKTMKTKATQSTNPKTSLNNDAKYLSLKTLAENKFNTVQLDRNASNVANNYRKKSSPEKKYLTSKEATQNEPNYMRLKDVKDNTDTNKKSIDGAKENSQITNAMDKSQKYIDKDKNIQFSEKAITMNKKLLGATKSPKNEATSCSSKSSGKPKLVINKCPCNDTIYEILENKTTMKTYPAKSTTAGREKGETRVVVTKDNDPKKKLQKTYKQYTCYNGNPLNYWIF